MQSVRHCEHRAVHSQKRFRAKKAVRFCAPSAGSGRAGSPPGWSAAGSPPSPIATPEPPEQAAVGVCRKDLVLPRVRSCSCATGL